jgi:hypothetical protein
MEINENTRKPVYIIANAGIGKTLAQDLVRAIEARNAGIAVKLIGINETETGEVSFTEALATITEIGSPVAMHIPTKPVWTGHPAPISVVHDKENETWQVNVPRKQGIFTLTELHDADRRIAELIAKRKRQLDRLGVYCKKQSRKPKPAPAKLKRSFSYRFLTTL